MHRLHGLVPAATQLIACAASASPFELETAFFEATIDQAPFVLTSESVRVYNSSIVHAFAELSVVADGPQGVEVFDLADVLGVTFAYAWADMSGKGIRSMPGERLLLGEDFFDFGDVGAIATRGEFIRTETYPHPPSGGVISDGFFEGTFAVARFGSFAYGGETYTTIGFVGHGFFGGWAPTPSAAVLLGGAGLLCVVRRRR